MSKLRADSIWAGISAEQQETLEGWLFDENLGYREAMERAEKEFGVKGSLASAARFYKRTERKRALRRLAVAKGMTAKITGDDPDNENVEGATVKMLELTAYELALAEPEKLKLNKLSWLMKVLNQHRRQTVREKQLEITEQKFQLLGLRAVTAELREHAKTPARCSQDEFTERLNHLRKEIFNEGPDGKKLPPRNANNPAAKPPEPDRPAESNAASP